MQQPPFLTAGMLFLCCCAAFFFLVLWPKRSTLASSDHSTLFHVVWGDWMCFCVNFRWAKKCFSIATLPCSPYIVVTHMEQPVLTRNCCNSFDVASLGLLLASLISFLLVLPWILGGCYVLSSVTVPQLHLWEFTSCQVCEPKTQKPWLDPEANTADRAGFVQNLFNKIKLTGQK